MLTFDFTFMQMTLRYIFILHNKNVVLAFEKLKNSIRDVTAWGNTSNLSVKDY